MTRLPVVTDREAGWRAKMAFYFTRRHLRAMTGRTPPTMLDPLRVFAHVPSLLNGYSRLEQAVAGVHLLSLRHRALAELGAATTARCSYCIDLGSNVARGWGLTDEELLAFPDYRTATCFSDVDRLVLDYAIAMTRTPVEVGDDLFDSLRRHFDVPQLVEMTAIVALENLRARFNLALDIGAAGFSEGAICARPT